MKHVVGCADWRATRGKSGVQPKVSGANESSVSADRHVYYSVRRRGQAAKRTRRHNGYAIPSGIGVDPHTLVGREQRVGRDRCVTPNVDFRFAPTGNVRNASLQLPWQAVLEPGICVEQRRTQRGRAASDDPIEGDCALSVSCTPRGPDRRTEPKDRGIECTPPCARSCAAVPDALAVTNSVRTPEVSAARSLIPCTSLRSTRDMDNPAPTRHPLPIG